MRLVVLGCSGSGPGPGSAASGYLVQAGDVRFTMDLGNGTFGVLQRHCDPWQLDAVVFSHLHADHCSDMSALLVHRLYHPFPPEGARDHRLPVYAPVEAPERFAGQWATSVAERAETDLTTALDFHPLCDGGVAELGGASAGGATDVATAGGVTLRAGRVDHPCEAYGLRVEHGGASLVYSGDTGPCDGLVELARGADVLLCEATWPHLTLLWDQPPPGIHLSGRQAGEHAAAAGVGRLLLTHVPVWFDGEALLAEAKEAFDGPVELVAPDLAYEI